MKWYFAFIFERMRPQIYTRLEHLLFLWSDTILMPLECYHIKFHESGYIIAHKILLLTTGTQFEIFLDLTALDVSLNLDHNYTIESLLYTSRAVGSTKNSNP